MSFFLNFRKEGNYSVIDRYIRCKKCGFIIKSKNLDNCEDYEDYEDYVIIYKNIFEKIEKKIVRIFNKLHEYLIVDEIGIFSINEMETILNIIRILMCTRINLYGLEKRLFNIEYFLMKLFVFLELDIGLGRYEIPRYYYFYDNIMKYSYDKICDLLVESAFDNIDNN